jgi:hypothetical protein
VSFPLPPLGVSTALLPFAIVALSMIGITVFVFGMVLPRDRRAPLVTQMLLALAVLGGGSVLLLSLLLVFVNPDGTSAWTWVLLAFNFMMMAPAGIWFIGLIVFRDRRVRIDDWTWPIAIALVTTGSEVLMGLLFVVGGTVGSLPLLSTFALGVSSIWFFWSMAAIMTALLLWAPLGPIERGALAALTVSAVIGPWVTTYPIVGGIAMGVLMAGVFGYLVRALLHHARVHAEEVGLLLGLAVAFLATALTGVALAATDGTPAAVLAFGSVMGVVMTVEIAYLVRRFYLGPAAVPWIHRTPEAETEAPLSPAPAGRTTAAERPAGEPAAAPGP